MSLRPGVSTTITRVKGNGASLSGIGSVDKSITINPPTPKEYGRTHTSPANIGTVS
tara:strand:+ start:218 stop:385 length:168 start_codon:yes stop_codon:yes gene_type:complete